MLNKALCFLVLISLTALADAKEKSIETIKLMQVVSGELTSYQNFPSQFIKPRNIHVWTPDSYSAEKQYDVLYVHDGQNQFDSKTTWNQQEWGIDDVAGELINSDKVRPFIVVAIDNGGDLRWQEYMPKKAIDYLDRTRIAQDDGIFQVDYLADKYLKFLVTELKPFIDRQYAVNTRAENTFLMGSSMGGLISMYAVSEYPEVFAGAACISTHWLGVMPDSTLPMSKALIKYVDHHLPKAGNHSFYFDHGTVDIDSYYPPLQKQVDQLMKLKGYSQSNWQTQVFEGENHSENAWQKRLHIPLQFLFANKSS